MKRFFSITLLSCLLAVFVFSDLAMGQLFRRAVPRQQAQQRLYYDEMAGGYIYNDFWFASYDYDRQRWRNWEWIGDPQGRNQRMPSQSMLPQTPPQGQSTPSTSAPTPTPQPAYQAPASTRAQPAYTPPGSNTGTTRGFSAPSIDTSQSLRLQPGDVILEINGETIYGQEDVTSAIARSPQTMYLTVRDGRSGQIAEFATFLNSSRPRFGVSHQTAPGGGSRVTGVNRNSPAERVYLVY